MDRIECSYVRDIGMGRDVEVEYCTGGRVRDTRPVDIGSRVFEWYMKDGVPETYTT